MRRFKIKYQKSKRFTMSISPMIKTYWPNLTIPCTFQEFLASKNCSGSTLVINFKSAFGTEFVTLENIGYIIKQTKIKLFFYNTTYLHTFIKNIKLVRRGLVCGYLSRLKVIGRGFRIWPIYNSVYFQLGFNVIFKLNLPKNITLKYKKKKFIYLFGINLAQIKHLTDQIRELRFPDTYTGKGLSIVGKRIKLRVGKVRIR
jgi:ribosomal protein L6P/L9E